jgi:hypothetical protein
MMTLDVAVEITTATAACSCCDMASMVVTLMGGSSLHGGDGHGQVGRSDASCY